MKDSTSIWASDNKEVNKLKTILKRFRKYIVKYPIKTPMGFLNIFILTYNIIVSLVILSSYFYFIFSIVFFIFWTVLVIYVYE